MTNNIRAMRKKAGLTQGELADAIGTTHGYVGKMERGEKRIALDWIHKIAEALHCRPDDLISSDDLGVLPSEPLLAEMLRFFLDREKAGHVPQDVLLDYALVLRSALLSLQTGELVEDDLPAVLGRMSHLLEAYDRKRQIVAGS